MSAKVDLLDILEKEEVEMIYKRQLSEDEWEKIRYNLKAKFWSKVRKEMTESLEDLPDYFLKDG
jgi:hypothetical protein